MAKKQKVSVTGTVVSIAYPSIRKGISVDYAALQQEVQVYAGLHGLKQRLGDAESGGSAAEKFEMASRIVESLTAGSWDLTTRAMDAGIVLEAVARIKGMKVAEVRDAVEKAGEEGPARIKDWRSNAKVAAMIAKIRAERAEAAAEDSDDDEIEV